MYAKLFASLYQGTLRGNADGLLVFTNLLAHCNQLGVVDIHPRAISEEIGISVERVREALKMLQSPDVESRTPDEEGRRLLPLDDHRDWGWRVVNHSKYRAIKNEDDRREQNRISQEKWRNKNKPSVSTVSRGKPMQMQMQIQIQKKKEKEVKNTVSIPEGISITVWQDFQKLRKTLKAPITETAIAGIRREAAKAGVSLEDAVKTCCERSWRGFKASWMQDAPTLNNTRAETAYQRSMREKMEVVAPSVAAKNPAKIDPNTYWETLTAKPLEIKNV